MKMEKLLKPWQEVQRFIYCPFYTSTCWWWSTETLESRRSVVILDISRIAWSW
jgi:hypothetical protein